MRIEGDMKYFKSGEAVWGETDPLTHKRWEYKLAQPLGSLIWQFFLNLRFVFLTTWSPLYSICV